MDMVSGYQNANSNHNNGQGLFNIWGNLNG